MRNQTKKYIIPTSFFGLMSSVFASEYTVKKGDTFSEIVQSYSSVNEKLNYSQMLALILKLNNKEKLSDFNHLRIGQKIIVPKEIDINNYANYYSKKYPPYWNPSLWKVSAQSKYIIQPGDSLGKLAKKKFPELPLFGKYGSINLLTIYNRSIKNIHKIYAGQELALPSDEKLAEYKNRSLKFRLPANKDMVDDELKSNDNDGHLEFKNIDKIDKEKKNSPTKLKKLQSLNKKLLESKTSLQINRALYDLIEFSSLNQLTYLKSFYQEAYNIYHYGPDESQFFDHLDRLFENKLSKVKIS